MAKSKTDEQDLAEAQMAAAGMVSDKGHIDPETARAYNEYLRNWRWNMSTWNALQREYMGRNYGRYDNLF